MKGFKNKKGISLIVLVITIIVMIILAAAIILSLSNSGIIGRASQAKSDSDVANLKEYTSVLKAEYDLNKTDSDFTTYANEKLEKAGYKVESGVIKIGEKEYVITEEGKVAEKQDIEIIARNEEDVNRIGKVGVGKERKLKVNTETVDSITWSSSDTSKATVDANGKVTGVAAGNVKITANVVADGLTYTVEHNMVVKSVSTFSIGQGIYTLEYSGSYSCYSDDTWQSWFDDGEFVINDYIRMNERLGRA